MVCDEAFGRVAAHTRKRAGHDKRHSCEGPLPRLDTLLALGHTPAALSFLSTLILAGVANQSTTASAMFGPMPSICIKSSTLALEIGIEICKGARQVARHHFAHAADAQGRDQPAEGLLAGGLDGCKQVLRDLARRFALGLAILLREGLEDLRPGKRVQISGSLIDPEAMSFSTIL